jgi:hypothetical protein
MPAIGNRLVLAQLRAVHAAVNAFPCVSDELSWGKADYWETPIEFMQHAGDCEDSGIIKYMTLRSLGVAAENMRVAVVTYSQPPLREAKQVASRAAPVADRPTLLPLTITRVYLGRFSGNAGMPARGPGRLAGALVGNKEGGGRKCCAVTGLAACFASAGRRS